MIFIKPKVYKVTNKAHAKDWKDNFIKPKKIANKTHGKYYKKLYSKTKLNIITKKQRK